MSGYRYHWGAQQALWDALVEWRELCVKRYYPWEDSPSQAQLRRHWYVMDQCGAQGRKVSAGSG